MSLKVALLISLFYLVNYSDLRSQDHNHYDLTISGNCVNISPENFSKKQLIDENRIKYPLYVFEKTRLTKVVQTEDEFLDWERKLKNQDSIVICTDFHEEIREGRISAQDEGSFQNKKRTKSVIAIIGIILLVYFVVFKLIFQKKTQQFLASKANNKLWHVLLLFGYAMLLSFCIIEIQQFNSDFLRVTFLEKYPLVTRFIMVSLFVFILLSLKVFFMGLISKVFELKDYYISHLNYFLRYSLWGAFWLSIGAMIIANNSGSVNKMHYGVAITLILIIIVRFFYLSMILINKENQFRKIHIISYLCFTEIIPVLIQSKLFLI